MSAQLNKVACYPSSKKLPFQMMVNVCSYFGSLLVKLLFFMHIFKQSEQIHWCFAIFHNLKALLKTFPAPRRFFKLIKEVEKLFNSYVTCLHTFSLFLCPFLHNSNINMFSNIKQQNPGHANATRYSVFHLSLLTWIGALRLASESD